MADAKILIIILLVFAMNSIHAQSDTINVNEEMNFSVESMPYYNGGEEQLLKFIGSQINYDSITNSTTQGIVYVLCWVDTLGNTTSHQILKGIREDLDQEALRVARLVKFEKPAMQRGKSIKIKYVIPVKFEQRSR